MTRRTPRYPSIAAVLSAGILTFLPVVHAGPANAPEAGVGSAVSKLFEQAQVSSKLMNVWSRVRAGDASQVVELKQLAVAGDPHAQLFYGYLLDNGLHIAADSALAARYFRQAADRVPLAKYNLGLLTLLGRGVPKNEAAAMRLFDETLKAQQIEQAALRLAQFHMREKRYSDAKRYAEIGVNFGNRFCYLFLGQIFYMEKDYRSAYHWSEKAQGAGVSDAGQVLSNLYGLGLISQPSPMMATGWDLVYRSGRSGWASPLSMPAGVWARDITQSDLDRARALANDFVIRSSRPTDPTPYTKTIAETRTWRTP